MSTPDYDDTTYDTYDEPEPSNGPKQLREAMKRAQQAADEATARAEAAERRAAFADAGLHTLTPAQRELLNNGYKGELTSEAIKAFAQEAGFLPTDPAPEPDVSAQAQGRIAQASGTAVPVPSEQTRIQELQAAAANGKEALLAQIREHGVAVGSE